MTTATDHVEVMSDGQPESLRVSVCGLSKGLKREASMASKETFIGGKVRAANGRFVPEAIILELRQSPTAAVVGVRLSTQEVARLIADLAGLLADRGGE